MRLSKERVRHIAESMAGRLQQEGYLDLTGDLNAFIDALNRAMTEELSLEDRLNAEVRQMLKVYEQQIEQGQVDYQKMFQMVKQKLVRERGLIL
ncbi:MAG: DUF507 family protein [Nitrospira sp.]|nr:DUF507 family protein [Nitrospira sp.]MDH5252990.1 DUF507 family protein [Nitrospira sp.]